MDKVELVAPGAPRRDLSDEEREYLAEQSVVSGLTMREFAARNHIGISSLSKWRRQFLTKRQPPGRPRLAAVKITDEQKPLRAMITPTNVGSLKITLPGDIVVQVEGTIDAMLLAGVLDLLRTRRR